jgi:hypothetical protein
VVALRASALVADLPSGSKQRGYDLLLRLCKWQFRNVWLQRAATSRRCEMASLKVMHRISHIGRVVEGLTGAVEGLTGAVLDWKPGEGVWHEGTQ